MRNRKEVLKDLVLLRGKIEDLSMELKKYPWDSEAPILKFKRKDLIHVVKKFIDYHISFDTLTNWANALECREDLEFESDDVKEIIFKLANPEINIVTTKIKLEEFIKDFR
ncbi:hypothetical protein KIM67_07030 [Flagellimonas sp. 389]|uniref:hypothetical protein n=1 Tax=Flagellimonas sp. 389 TaxID=2835862 RepID=UPI001BD56CAE|nr:hypothetical protein [Flagellimonas sp. 389]MBS9462158.1 hypothetical protein [Flagellimonas sp. 389]